MDHQEKHHQQHRHEREHEKKEHAEHERQEMKSLASPWPVWFLVIGILLIGAVISVWVFFF